MSPKPEEITQQRRQTDHTQTYQKKLHVIRHQGNAN